MLQPRDNTAAKMFPENDISDFCRRPWRDTPYRASFRISLQHLMNSFVFCQTEKFNIFKLQAVSKSPSTPRQKHVLILFGNTKTMSWGSCKSHRPSSKRTFLLPIPRTSRGKKKLNQTSCNLPSPSKPCHRKECSSGVHVGNKFTTSSRILQKQTHLPDPSVSN